jgi:phage/plasmid-associated DNA primase
LGVKVVYTPFIGVLQYAVRKATKTRERNVAAIESWCRSPEVRNASDSAAAPDDITTDSGASDAFANAKRGELIYRDDTDTWFKRDGRVFRPISYVQLQGEAKRFMQEQVCSAGIVGSTRFLLSKGKIDNLITLSREHFRIEPSLLDEARHLVGCSDGTILDLHAQKIATNATGLVTKTVRCHFDPDAECPQFQIFLSQIFAGNQSVIPFVQRAIGYTLSGNTSEQCLFVLWGAVRMERARYSTSSNRCLAIMQLRPRLRLSWSVVMAASRRMT